MKKKYLALALAASMVVKYLAGCGSNNASTGDTLQLQQKPPQNLQLKQQQQKNPP